MQRTFEGTKQFVVTVVVPRVTTPGDVVGTIALADDPTVYAEFDFSFKALPTDLPSVLMVAPTRGPLLGGNKFRINIAGLVQVNSIEEATVSFNALPAEILQVSSSLEATEITVKVPRGLEAGVITVIVYANVLPQASTSCFYEYLPRTPAVSHLQPISGPWFGGYPISMQVANLPSTTSTEDVLITFDQITVTPQKVRLLTNADGNAMQMQFNAPNFGSVANVTAMVRSRDQRTRVWSTLPAEFNFLFDALKQHPQIEFVRIKHSTLSGANVTVRTSGEILHW